MKKCNKKFDTTYPYASDDKFTDIVHAATLQRPVSVLVQDQLYINPQAFHKSNDHGSVVSHERSEVRVLDKGYSGYTRKKPTGGI